MKLLNPMHSYECMMHDYECWVCCVGLWLRVLILFGCCEIGAGGRLDSVFGSRGCLPSTAICVQVFLCESSAFLVVNFRSLFVCCAGVFIVLGCTGNVLELGKGTRFCSWICCR